jgi:hypothetical protein
MRIKLLGAVVTALLFLGCVPLANAAPIMVDFDSIAATCCYGDVIPNTGRGPQLTFGILQINNGVVMDNSGWGGATTLPNLYGTCDFCTLADGSTLPGNIDMIFASPVSSVGFDVINGFNASQFFGYAFDSNGLLLGTDMLDLNCINCGGDVGHMSFAFGGISQVVVTSLQGAGNVDFAVDTISYNAVPEPGSLMLLGSGVIGLWSQRKRFFN